MQDKELREEFNEYRARISSWLVKIDQKLDVLKANVDSYFNEESTSAKSLRKFMIKEYHIAGVEWIEDVNIRPGDDLVQIICKMQGQEDLCYFWIRKKEFLI
jgi:hypothetical protein